ncbi:unnamed protein product [Urochloa humidicola]
MAALALPLVGAALLTLAAAWLWDYAVVRNLWRPRAVAAAFRAQGVRGPPYRFLRGSNDDVRRMRAEADAVEMDVRDHDYLRRVMPHLLAWKDQYGAPFLFWFGSHPRICLFDYESVRQVLWNKSGHFMKTDAHPTILAMLGKGLVLVDGTDWVRHRRVVNPAFAMDKLKMMTTTMVSCADRLIKECQELASNNGSGEVEVEFSKHFQELTAEVISRTAFGSSYKEGKEVFHTQKKLLALALATLLNLQLPGFKYLPTKNNRLKWTLENKIKTTLMAIIQPSVYPEWQERLREEVLRECGKENPTADMLSKLKEMTMVLLETLRLYGPVMTMLRKPISDIRLGSLSIPKGTGIVIPIPILHRDKEVWGPNANEFDPLRFENGITNAAKTPQALLGFSIGPRSCIGQNFAMLEAKSVMAMILQKFSFTLSPKYVHAPIDLITLQPKFGLPIVLRPLDASC